VLSGLFGNVDPAWVALARDLNADERVEGPLIDAIVALAYDRAVDIA
jgi:hypothetical protein